MPRLADVSRSRRKLILSAVGIFALTAPILVSSVRAALPETQSQSQGTTASAPDYQYDVASIKQWKSGERGVRSAFTPDGFTATDATLFWMISFAYGIERYRMFGGPSWIHSEYYDIEAKMDASVIDGLQKLGPNERKLAQQHMLQALLADRFNLALHKETKEMPV